MLRVNFLARQPFTLAAVTVVVHKRSPAFGLKAWGKLIEKMMFDVRNLYRKTIITWMRVFLRGKEEGKEKSAILTYAVAHDDAWSFALSRVEPSSQDGAV